MLLVVDGRRAPGHHVQEHLLVRRWRAPSTTVVHVELALHWTQLTRTHVVRGHGAARGKGFPGGRRRHAEGVAETTGGRGGDARVQVVSAAGGRGTRGTVEQRVRGQVVATRPVLGDDCQVLPALGDLQLIVQATLVADFAGVRDVRALLLTQLGHAWRETWPGRGGRGRRRTGSTRINDVRWIGGVCRGQGTETARGVATGAGEYIGSRWCIAVREEREEGKGERTGE